MRMADLAKPKMSRGLTLAETVVGAAVFLIVALAVYQGYVAIVATYRTAQIKLVAAEIAQEEIELMRNMPYGEVGLAGGIPSGVLEPVSQLTRDGIPFEVRRYVRNIDDPFDGTLGGTPNDTSPADYKLAELEIVCTNCPGAETFRTTARVAPKNLETASANGALFVRAIDGNGLPVAGAAVEITNPDANPPISITDTTDADGWLKVVDVPPANQAYQVTVSKTDYSTDKTYTATAENPNPVKPHATVVLGEVTQITFAIDRTSTLNFRSTGVTCGPAGSAHFSLDGSKLIGANPDVLKFSEEYDTDVAGAKDISGLEWDTYALALQDSGYSLVGVQPLFPLSVSPGVTQNVSLLIEPKNPNELLVTVKDLATGLPVANASVRLESGQYSETKTTGVGFLKQTDWSGGDGQANFIDQKKFFSQDGNLSVVNPAGTIKLATTSEGFYVPSGMLESSTFDTGSSATFKTVSWDPASQPLETGSDSVRIQLATATTSEPLSWSFLGPDGTSNTYYTLAAPDIHPGHSGDRFLRYKLFLNTASTTFTPLVSDVSFVFTAACIPAGQVSFGGRSLGAYALTVTHSGYQDFAEQVSLTGPWQEKEVILIPEGLSMSPPAIGGFEPLQGPAGGVVTLSGSGFTGVTSVTVNGTYALFTVNSATQITATVPSGASSGPIAASNSLGTGVSASSFTVVPPLVPAVIDSFSPESGLPGASVIISGSGFSDVNGVRFNAAAAVFAINSDSQITATVPGDALTGRVMVSDQSGSAMSASNFTVIVPPVIDGFSPAGGQAGTSVTITGSGFSGVTGVKFGDVLSPAVSVISDSEVRATAPAGGTGRITVTNPAGSAVSSSIFFVTFY